MEFLDFCGMKGIVWGDSPRHVTAFKTSQLAAMHVIPDLPFAAARFLRRFMLCQIQGWWLGVLWGNK